MCCDNNFESRMACVKEFLKQLARLPLALISKFGKTFFRSIGVVLGAVLVVVTLGSCRDFFVRRMTALAEDLAEWVVIPFSIMGSFVRVLLALFVHPRFF
jgi:hypothetical protein